MEEGRLESTITAAASAAAAANITSLVKPIRCIVKLGGAAITCKNELERINGENLETVASQLRETMINAFSSHTSLGMDWSRQPGNSEFSCSADDFDGQQVVDVSPFIVVHGAGSFGHFQASKSGVHKGGLDKTLVKAGFVATRISVTSLNLQIVRALAREGIPSVGLSPFSCGWSTCNRVISIADLSAVAESIDSGFIPVLHGDAVLDDSLGCTILSGDVIIRHLAEELKPDYVVFLTDVLGVYDRPPTESDAILLREISKSTEGPVGEDGSWAVIQPALENMKEQAVKTSVADHDTTGGMMTKISEAAAIAKLGIDVYIVKAATIHSVRALRGELKGNIPDDWLGTIIRASK